jgi:hypothetical protein
MYASTAACRVVRSHPDAPASAAALDDPEVLPEEALAPALDELDPPDGAVLLAAPDVVEALVVPAGAEALVLDDPIVSEMLPLAAALEPLDEGPPLPSPEGDDDPDPQATAVSSPTTAKRACFMGRSLPPAPADVDGDRARFNQIDEWGTANCRPGELRSRKRWRVSPEFHSRKGRLRARRPRLDAQRACPFGRNA